MGGSISKYVFRVREPTYMDDDGVMMYVKRIYNERGGTTGKAELNWLTTRRLSKIPAVMLECKDRPAKYVLLLSHGNMEDLGIAASDASAYCDELQCDIFIYEYTGFGISTGRPSELDCYADIVAAHDHLLHEAHVPPEKIVLFGRSMGSGPSVFLASHRPVGGLILVAPFMSCARVVQNFKVTPPFDIFPNIDRIASVNCEVLFVHGQRDQIVPIEHSTELARKAPNVAIPLWIEKAGHNNVEKDFQVVVVSRLKRFLSELVPPSLEQCLDVDADVLPLNKTLSKLKVFSDVHHESRSSFDFSRNNDEAELRSSIFSPEVNTSEKTAEPVIYSGLDLRSNSVLRSGLLDTTDVEWRNEKGDQEQRSNYPLTSVRTSEQRRRSLDSMTMRRRSDHKRASPQPGPATSMASARELQLVRAKLPSGEMSRCTDDYLIEFLRARDFDVSAAVELFIQFENLCGGMAIDPRVPMPLPKVRQTLAKNIMYLTGAVDLTGAPVIFVRVANFRPRETSWVEIVRLLLFYKNVLCTNSTVSRMGIGFVLDLRYCSSVNFSAKRTKQFLHFVQKVYPAKVQSFVIVDAPVLMLKQWIQVRRMVGSELSQVMRTKCSRAALREQFDHSVLPDFLGGTLDSSDVLTVVETARKCFAEKC
eukprot:Plantae.Rhodophyta-Purpureofilum_apyrenoidigerum.ctg7387.p1 GENE.Plantae.Rhodophyta-Purpureofilum_apyrenoidigerum.ctg7387~~Plantae.Rhodophyta-Purpureofilum_apyrenoidigerum.ctg7387.p1  ORF type:complete len:648 (-),score=93.33 Plantae.Rhodophyta-Purpureofilum_apyrenoidigerum.ctg7387:115-2058(-)